MNSSIEFHDSRIEAITEVGTQIFLFLTAYLHRSEGKPGVDAGTGWKQAAALSFYDAEIESADLELPVDISYGGLMLEGVEFPNEIPVPLDHSGAIEMLLSVVLPTEEIDIVIRGSRVTLALLGDAVYIEDFNP